MADRPGKNFPLLPRGKNTDKTDYGHTLVVAGSRGMSGAAFLTAEAALCSGSGLVTLAAPRSLLGQSAKRFLPECLTLPLPETSSGSAAFSSLRAVLSYIRIRKVNALAVGPGLSQEKTTARLVRELVQNSPSATVLDADGLNSFSASGGRGYLQALKKRHAPLVLTPHDGEFERLFSKRCPRDTASRMRLAKKISSAYHVTLVLKGYRSVVAGGKKVYVNRTGNPGMAKGGSGDVLTGIIAAFLAQGLSSFEAASWGVYFHGRAGDLAVKEKGELGLLAGDIIKYLPKAFKSEK